MHEVPNFKVQCHLTFITYFNVSLVSMIKSCSSSSYGIELKCVNSKGVGQCDNSQERQ